MKKLNPFLLIFIAVLFSLNFISSVVVESQFVTLYPGESKEVDLEVENNEDIDIEDVSLRLLLEGTSFTSVGSSEKDLSDLDEDEDDSVSFTLRPSTDIKPGDYNIPYEIKYVDADDNDEKYTEKGTFGIRVSAKTEIEFSVYTSDNPIVGETGEITLEIINKGLGEIKSLSVEVFPQGFDIISKEKIFVGTVDSDDTDIATFDVVFNSEKPILKANIDYKDFDNKDQTETITTPFKVYTKEEAIKLGLIQQSNLILYFIIVVVLIIIWIVWRGVRKRKRNNRKKSLANLN